MTGEYVARGRRIAGLALILSAGAAFLGWFVRRVGARIDLRSIGHESERLRHGIAGIQRSQRCRTGWVADQTEG